MILGGFGLRTPGAFFHDIRLAALSLLKWRSQSWRSKRAGQACTMATEGLGPASLPCPALQCLWNSEPTGYMSLGLGFHFQDRKSCWAELPG